MAAEHALQITLINVRIHVEWPGKTVARLVSSNELIDAVDRWRSSCKYRHVRCHIRTLAAFGSYIGASDGSALTLVPAISIS